MPLKPRPNTAETVKSPASLWVDRKPDHSYELANRTGEDRAQAADPVGDKAPNLPAQKSETEQHREHRRADRRRNPDIGAQSHKMALRHRHWHATAETRGSKHR